MYLDFSLLLWIAPALILGLIAQAWISSAYARAGQLRARMTGAQAARMILDSNGMHDIPVEETSGHLSDHYDPATRVVRLSTQVYRQPSLAAVGIAAHEVGHAIQHAVGYVPLVLRNAAVPLANFGGNFGMMLLMAGIVMKLTFLGWAGILLFGGVVLFQLINLPVEFNASSRAKRQLVDLGIVDASDMAPVKSVLWAAALTYVAATLQSLLTFLYYASFFLGGSRQRNNNR
jgi:uncharacterized protein